MTLYYERLAAAFVRGLPDSPLPPQLLTEELDLVDWEEVIRLGLAAGLRLHRFKRSEPLARVRRVLGMLRALGPSDLLDLGTGRGAFLWPLLDERPELQVTCVDRLDYRVADICSVARGGVAALHAIEGDLTALPFDDAAFDVVTMLEVLEHVSDTDAALAEVCRVCRRALVLSVPSKEDDNPEHIHRFRVADLESKLKALGMRQVKEDSVLNHLCLLAYR